MSTEDPRITLTRIFEEISLFYDDNAIIETIPIEEEFNEKAFKDYDVVITLAPQQTTEKPISLNRKHVLRPYKISVYARDKTNVTTSRLLWDAEREINRLVDKYRFQPGGMLRSIRIANANPKRRALDTRPPIFVLETVIQTNRFASIEGT